MTRAQRPASSPIHLRNSSGELGCTIVPSCLSTVAPWRIQLLRKDGTFDAGVAYGSADGFAKGTWQVENNTVTLKSETKPASNGDLSALFQDLQLAIEPNCLAVDFGNGKACFRRQ